MYSLKGHAVTSQHFKDSAPTQRPRVFSIWDQSGIRIVGIMRVYVCLGAILIPEYLDFHSGYSAPRERGKTSAQSHGISSDRNIRDFLWRWSNYFDQTQTNLPSSFHKLFIAELFFTCLRMELGKGINLSEYND